MAAFKCKRSSLINRQRMSITPFMVSLQEEQSMKSMILPLLLEQNPPQPSCLNQ